MECRVLLCALIALLGTRAAAADSAGPGGPPAFTGPDGTPVKPERVFPDMSTLRDPSPARLAARVARAAQLWASAVISPEANCTIAAAPCEAGALTTFWAAANQQQRSWMMMALAKDAYPRPEHLGASGDGPPPLSFAPPAPAASPSDDHKCRLTAKWRWLGAEQVKIIQTSLTYVVMLKVGSTVHINFRGTWGNEQTLNNVYVWPYTPLPQFAPRARVHPGFTESLDQSWPQIITALSTDFGCGAPACEFVVTGHSRGGGLGALAAARLAADHAALGSVVEFVSYGGVRAGDRTFQDAWNSRFGAVTSNWWNKIDWVPQQPFTYRQSPRLRITEEACPTATTTGACYKVNTINRRGRPVRRNKCSGSFNTTAAAFDHLPLSYMEALRNCTGGALPLSPECADWL
ncbi:MAG: hypothetical protein J3K34DRAFT_428085 [Monoraphidium minutum]|nr:MAG: hypothetical protein J3K34DRAFT_428085 [Monoraphidium minutum]